MLVPKKDWKPCTPLPEAYQRTLDDYVRNIEEQYFNGPSEIVSQTVIPWAHSETDWIFKIELMPAKLSADAPPNLIEQ